MTGSLSPAQVEHFRREGWLYPLDAISPEEAAANLAALDSYDGKLGPDATLRLKIKAQVVAPWMTALGRNPRILDAVESLIGPDILLFGASVFAKRANDTRFVSWHQDSAYYGLDPHEEVTAWVALTPSMTANGCLRVLPRSHLMADFRHEETYDPQNLLARGQSIQGIDESEAVNMELRAGQFSLHHERTAHCSAPNPSDQRRVGVAFFFMPAHTRSTLGRRGAMLVRGEDRHGHWDRDPEPRMDLDPVCLDYLEKMWAGYRNSEVKQAAEQGLV
ncbi:phytanoyl-CoA dioxygenase family protein [Pararoseomonas indoligenes]|uniref:Phytanoyl-CoA dioxygenase family protein n=1 Tax=Roseomonas indoligenes TaxID=2820811 RepID=A0A940N8S4_9PROT|nr:phytanoyl-CoA dioxygenase family protein [Pararoseomonas indoligenes]MBP0496132.1 phytanoyl-CoA dioxygenase family protein [Pararoseomonas indoligenes]